MPAYTLYSYFRSSCSARLRIALNIKGLSYDQVPVNLLKNEQSSEKHRQLNPSGTVPLLVCHNGAGGDFRIGQSVAALEYLDEVHPQRPLIPRDDPRARAVVRTLVAIVACDIQPVTNLRILRKVRELGGDAEAWNRELATAGFAAYEAVARESAGVFSVGDEISLADACLVPAFWNAQRFGVDVEAFPTVMRIVRALEKEPAVLSARYSQQPDTPEELRES
ncbi:hypothetical protein VUR80DRAFT_7702 [Thermomyces stellatus]